MEWSRNASASENNQKTGSNNELADIFISGGRPIDNHFTFDGPIGRWHLSIGDGRSRDSRQFRRSAHYYRRITLSIADRIYFCAWNSLGRRDAAAEGPDPGPGEARRHHGTDRHGLCDSAHGRTVPVQGVSFRRSSNMATVALGLSPVAQLTPPLHGRSTDARRPFLRCHTNSTISFTVLD